MTGRIFISYRRGDDESAAGRLYDRLLLHFDREQLFMEVDANEPGVDFVRSLEERVAACIAFIAVIGPRWLNARNNDGAPRLDNPTDYVRVEIESALKRDIRVIPVLVDGAAMPRLSDLPPSLQPLARRNAVEIAPHRFAADCDDLARSIKHALGATRASSPPLRRSDEAEAKKGWLQEQLEEEARRAAEERHRKIPTQGPKQQRKGPSPRIVKNEYVVWYGTNRRRYEASDLTKGYSAERDSKVHYGSCRVYIPEAHKIGSLGSPWWKRLITRSDDRLKLRGIKETGSTSFWRQIAFRLSRLSVTERYAVIFVHGYNVSFHDAALRAAQIGFDLSVKGTMAFFSWPSQGSLGGYMADSATIEASEQDITNFMTDFVTHSGAEAVHVIAHSMGNRGVLRAVNRIAQRAQQKSGVPFGQVILAAADVDSDTFRQLCGAYAQVARRTTLYVSERDRAVEASHWLHQFPRVGLMPPVCVASGIDTVAVTNVDLTLLGHGYIGDARGVLTDIYQLITKGSPPKHRFGISEASTPGGERYWLIRG